MKIITRLVELYLPSCGSGRDRRAYTVVVLLLALYLVLAVRSEGPTEVIAYTVTLVSSSATLVGLTTSTPTTRQA